MGTVQAELVGREGELADLDLALAAAAGGSGAIRLLVGEPGIGKTRLADEVSARASGLGFQVAWGRAWEAGGAPPLWPWLEILGALGSRAALAGADGAPAGAGGGEDARFRVHVAAADALRAAAARAPVLVVLDDLHAADEATLDLLLLVARRLRGSRLLVLGTARDAEARRIPGVEERLVRVAREGRRLDLAPLRPDEVRRLAERLARRALPEDLLERVSRASEGNPLFVDEMVRLLAQRGALGDAGLPLPGSVRAVLLSRLALLPAGVQRVLEAASVLGRTFDAAAVEALLPGEPAGAAGEALEAAAATSGLVAPVPGEPRRFTFSHALVRDALHQGLPEARRAALHHACSMALERAGAPPAEVAHHALLGLPAGPAGRAVAIAREAAARASAAGAYGAAASLLARALDALGPAREPALRCDLGIALAEAEARAGLADRAAETGARAADVARALSDPARLARAVLATGFTTTLGVVNTGLVRGLREALASLGDRDAGLAARLNARLASALQPAPDPAEPIALALRAVALARRAGDETTLLATLYAACSALGDLAGPGEREPLDRESAELAARLGDVAVEQRARARQALDLVELGRLSEADDAIAEVQRLGELLAVPHYRWRPPLLRSMRALMAGRFAESDRHVALAARLAAEAGGFDAEVGLPMHRLGAALVRGKYDREATGEAVRALEARLAIGDTTVFAVFELAAAARLGEIETLRASTLVRSGFAGLPGGLSAADVQISAALCEAFAAAAGEERCEELLRRLRGLEDREVCWGMMGLVDLGPFAGPLAVLAAAAGDASGALAFFEKALSRAAERGLAAAEVGLRAERATLLGWIGRAGEAAAERGRAGELAAALDMEPSRVLATREALGLAPRPAPAPAARPAAAQPPSFSLVREGDVWAVSHAGSTFRVRHGRGVEMLASLVASPERAFHCTELDLPAEAVAEALGDAGEVLDARARDAYRRRAGELQAELAEAEEFHDAGRADRARGELEALARELARGAGLGGRTRRAGSQVERSRVNVQRRLKDAIQRIGEHDPGLGRHLERAVRTGTFCVYRP